MPADPGPVAFPRARSAAGKLLFVLAAAAAQIACDAPATGRSHTRTLLESDVASLIASMPDDGRKQANAFAALEKLGTDAVPYIVKHMDSRRKLPVREIVLGNASGSAFESRRVYAPEVVVDAVAAILNQLTGVSFGYIVNGSDNSSRAAVVSDWRTWCRKTYPGVRDGCVPD